MEELSNDLFFSVYKYLGFGIVFASVFLLAWPRIKELGAKGAIQLLWHEVKNEKHNRYVFLFAVVFFMILSRTLICRDIWKVPWENPIGEFDVFTKDGKWNVEGFENIILFIPLSFLFFCMTNAGSKKRILADAAKYSFLFSCFIEVCQLFGRLGTFQLSDILQNTLGGLIGGLIYWICYTIKHRKKL